MKIIGASSIVAGRAIFNIGKIVTLQAKHY
jgi:hypothetical protein